MSPASSQTTVSNKGEKSYKGLSAIPKFSRPQVDFTCPSLGRAWSEGSAALNSSGEKNNLDNDDINMNFHKGFFQ